MTLPVRLAALDLALAEADRCFGPVAVELVTRAQFELVAATPRKRKARRRTG